MQYSIPVFLLIALISFSNINPCSAKNEISYHIIESKDSLDAIKTIKGFLIWYKLNYKKSSGFRLVATDKTGHYFVDQKVCGQYLNHLKSNGFISNDYINKWQKYFVEMQQNFQDNQQNEGPPEGFDYDLISGTQEPELFYNPSENLKFTIVDKEKSKVVIKSSDQWVHQFTLSKFGKKWKIDEIEMLGYSLN